MSGEDSRVFCRSGHHGVCRHQCPPDGEAQEAQMKRQIYTNQPVMHILIWNNFKLIQKQNIINYTNQSYMLSFPQV